MAAITPPRPVASPHGIPVSCLFYGHDPVTRDYKDASKIKTIDAHPVLPWVATADEVGNVCIWNYMSATLVLSFPVESLKDSQRAGVEALEAHTAFATSAGVPVPDVTGPGLGIGIGVDPGAASGSGTESFISAVVGGVKRRPVLSSLPEDARAAPRTHTGHVRAVRFADDAVIAACTGVYGAAAAASRSVAPPHGYDTAASLPLAGSIDELLAHMSHTHTVDAAAASSTSHVNPAPLRAVPHAPQHWLVIMCEARVLILDYSTRAVIDVPTSSLLIEASGPNALGRTVTRGRPAVHSCTPLGPGVLAFGCEDGIIRIWNADLNVVVQCVRIPGGSSRPISHLRSFSSAVPSTRSASGIETRMMMLSGCADGVVNVWEVIAGQQVADNGRGGVQMVRLGSDLTDLSVNIHTQQIVALASDRSVSVWDGGARPSSTPGAATAGSPRITSSKVSTSSTASETGVGSKMLSGALLGAHPFFPPSTVLATSKGPHLELCVAGSTDKAGEAGVIFYDLRAARPGLPAKCKVYVMCGHPNRPDVFCFGTNIGVFVIQVAPHYCASALCVTHPKWCTTGLDAASASAPTRSVHVYVNNAGALVAADVTLATRSASSAPDSSARSAAARDGGAPETVNGSAAAYEDTSVAGGDAASMVSRQDTASVARTAVAAEDEAAMETAPATVSARERILLPSFLPPVLQPAATTGPGSAGNANAVAALAAQIKPGSAGGALPGARGVRLRVSGSGRYLAAVWPEYRCYVILKLTLLEQETGALAEVETWRAETVDSGGGLDVAWGPAVVDPSQDDAPPVESAPAEAPEATTEAPAAPAASVTPPLAERYVVIEPGIPVVVKPVYGGGMPIGSAPPAKGKGKSAAAAPALPHFPNTMKLMQLVRGDDAAVKASAVLAEVPLPQEPVAAWSGPVLALALASDTGSAASSVTAALASSSLQLFGWNVFYPERQPEPTGDAALTIMAKKAKEKAERPRLPVVGATSATPPPSPYAAVNGNGVVWSPDGSRVAVCGSTSVQLFLVVPTHLCATAGIQQRRLQGVRCDVAGMLELGRLRCTAVSAVWVDHVLLLATTDGKVTMAFPPCADVTTADGVQLFVQRRARRITDIVCIDIQNAADATMGFPSLVDAPVMPVATPGPLIPFMAGVAGIRGGCCITLHWTCTRMVAPEHADVVAGTTGITFVAHRILHALPRALLALAGGLAPSVAGGDDPAQRYADATASAAYRLACEPQRIQDVAASLALTLGAPSLALSLPSLSPVLGLPIALSVRPELQAKSFLSFGRVDIPMALSYLRRVFHECADMDLLALSLQPALEASPVTHTHTLRNNVGVWPVAAALLALASVQLPSTQSDNNKALHALAQRLNLLGLAVDADMAAALVAVRPAAAAHALSSTPTETDSATSGQLLAKLRADRQLPV